MRTKLICIALCLFMAGAVVFATGGRQQSASGRQTLEIGIVRSPNVIDLKDNYLTRQLERIHDIDLAFYEFPSVAADASARVSLLAASNSLPETLWGQSLVTADQALELGSNGALISLNRYFNDPAKTPYFNSIPQADRNMILSLTRSPDGNNYSFSSWNPGESWNQAVYRYFINREWLAKLGLQEPKTTEELRTVLRAFVDRDPNGNGRRDEMGVFGWYNLGAGDPVRGLINAFVYFPDDMISLDASGNTVTAPFTEPGFRTALQYLNSLYREGLLDASTFTVDETGFRAAVNADPMIIGLTVSYSNSFWAGTTSSPNFRAMYPFMAPLSSPISPGYSVFRPDMPIPQTWITNRAKNVDLAVKVMDSFYEPELGFIAGKGEEGVNWTRDPAILANLFNAYVESGILPRIIYATVNAAWATPHAAHWQGQNPIYAPFETNSAEGIVGVTRDSPDLEFSDLMMRVVNTQINAPRHPQYLLPRRLAYTLAEGESNARVVADITQYVNRSIPEFTIGTRDINSEAAWNAYLRDIESMGLQTWLRNAQAAYNRMR